MNFLDYQIHLDSLTEDMEDIRQIFSNVSNREDMFSTGLGKN